MRYLIINQYYTFGGTEVQTKREFNYFRKQGHKVLLLTLDPELEYHQSMEDGHLNIVNKYTDKKLDFFRLFEDRNLTKEIQLQISLFKPDCVHLNNIFYSPNSIYKALENKKVFQTIRDFRVLCPKNTCVYEDGITCTGYGWFKCMHQCGFKSPKMLPKLCLKLLVIKKLEMKRKRCCAKIVCPSECLTEYCRAYGYDVECINNPFEMKEIENFYKVLPKSKRIVMFYGALSKNKGVNELLSAFLFAEKKLENLELHIVGSISDDIDKNLFEEAIKHENIKYFGQKEYRFIMEKLKEVYAVIIPSLWLENYPNTALEGIATDCIICGSNRGGIPEFIVDNRCKFDVLKREEIIRTLQFISISTLDEYKVICAEQKKKFLENNSQENYYSRILKTIDSLYNEAD